DGLAHGWVLRGAALGRLDEDVLFDLLWKVVVEEPLALARLTDVVVLVVGLLHPDDVADHESDGDEGEPAPDRLLAMLGAPPPATRSESVRVHAKQGRSANRASPSGTLACSMGA